MECKNTSIDRSRQRGFTLVEITVATGLSTLMAAVMVFLTMFTNRSFVAMDNYTDMDLKNQLALDQISRLIRQARQVTAISTNSLSLLDANGNPLQCIYDPTAKTLTVQASSGTNVYLTICNSLQFWLYQHTPISNTFDCYSSAYPTNARLVQFTWSCSRPLVGTKVNSETVQSAEVALRNH